MSGLTRGSAADLPACDSKAQSSEGKTAMTSDEIAMAIGRPRETRHEALMVATPGCDLAPNKRPKPAMSRRSVKAPLVAKHRHWRSPVAGRCMPATWRGFLRRSLVGAALFVLCVSVPVARADFVTDSFGGQGCSRPGTIDVADDEELGRVLKFDLSALGKGTAVYRAILKLELQRRGYSQPVLLYPVVRKGGKLVRAEQPLELRPPFFQDFDATELVRRWAKGPAENLGLVMASAPGWRRAATALHVSYEGAAKPTPPVTGIEAAFLNGQVFLRFKEIADVVAAEETNFADFEGKVLAAWKERSVSYRVYRHSKPITAKNLGQCELMCELEEICPAHNLDAIPTTEFPGQNSRPSKVAPGGNRRLDVIVQRYRVPMERQLSSGENLAVMTARQEGSFHYAVTAVVNGYEGVKALDAGNSLASPLAEKIEPVAPLLQEKKVNKRRDGEEVYETYVCFYEPPYWPTPLRVYMCSAYDAATAEKTAAPLEICTGTYGGQSPYNLGRRHVPKAYYVAPPVTGAMWQGIHECIGTLKSYDQGIVRNYTARQILALVDWARKKWPNIDADRVAINGQFAIWALRRADTFAMVIADPYGNFSAGIEMQKHGWQWGPYPAAAKNEDGQVDQWEYLNVAKWIRDNPAVEIPFYVGKASSASHVGDMGFMPAPEVYRVLLETRRAFAAHYGASQGFGGPPREVCAMPIRRSQAVPAFSYCSLDDMVGDGDQWGGAAGGTIGSGDPWGRFNADLRWGFDDLADEPGKFEVTVWLDGGAKKPTCTVNLTPRHCRKFKPAPGKDFQWTAADEKGSVVQKGATKANEWGLVTIERLTVPKSKLRVSIVAR